MSDDKFERAMSNIDQFEREYRGTQERVEKLRNQLDFIENAEPGKPIAAQKYLMKATFATLQIDVNTLKQLEDEYTNAPHKHHQLGKSELARRISLIQELVDLVDGQLTQEYRNCENKAALMTKDRVKEQYQRDDDGEFDQTRDLDNRGILQ